MRSRCEEEGEAGGEGVRGRVRREEGEEVGMEGVRGERVACGPSKFSIPRTSRKQLVDLIMSVRPVD